MWRRGELLESLGCQPGRMSPFGKGPGLIICFLSPPCSFLSPLFLLLTVVSPAPLHTHTHTHACTHVPFFSGGLRPAGRAACHEGQRSPARERSAVGAGLWPPDCLVGGACARRAGKANSGSLLSRGGGSKDAGRSGSGRTGRRPQRTPLLSALRPPCSACCFVAAPSCLQRSV